MLGCDNVAEGLNCGCMFHQQVSVRMSHFISTNDTLKTVYFAYFKSLIKYNKIFWVNLVNRKKVFSLQKNDIESNDGSRTEVFLQRIV